MTEGGWRERPDGSWAKIGPGKPLNFLVAGRRATDFPAPAKRLRQSTAPLLNKLETRLLEHLKRLHPGVTIHGQGWRVRLANGLWFKVDLVGVVDGRWTAWEAKGPRAFRGGFENLKMAASVWTEVRWVLMWEQDGQWKSQDVRP